MSEIVTPDTLRNEQTEKKNLQKAAVVANEFLATAHRMGANRTILKCACHIVMAHVDALPPSAPDKADKVKCTPFER